MVRAHKAQAGVTPVTISVFSRSAFSTDVEASWSPGNTWALGQTLKRNPDFLRHRGDSSVTIRSASYTI